MTTRLNFGARARRWPNEELPRFALGRIRICAARRLRAAASPTVTSTEPLADGRGARRNPCLTVTCNRARGLPDGAGGRRHRLPAAQRSRRLRGWDLHRARLHARVRRLRRRGSQRMRAGSHGRPVELRRLRKQLRAVVRDRRVRRDAGSRAAAPGAPSTETPSPFTSRARRAGSSSARRSASRAGAC